MASLRATATTARRWPLVRISRMPPRFDLGSGHLSYQQSVCGCIQSRADFPVSDIRYTTGFIVFPRLISSWCWSKMRANRARSFETRWIIDSSFESQRCNRSNAWNGHHSHADVILRGGAFYTPILLQKVLIQNQACIQERHQGVRQNFVHFD